MSAPLRVVELFAGAGGMALGFKRAGYETVALCEIAEFPRRVLRHRFPGVPLYGDVSALDGRALVAEHGPVDIIAGGSPCQDLSVAGKRAGLAGARSGLFHEQMRLWDETGATYCLWENVDGARSSSNGEDFAAVLSAFVGAAVPVPSDGWGSAGVVAGPAGVAAWRVLDAQWFGVPQRRRRVFVLGARAGGVDPAEVLLEPESLRGHPAPRRDAGQDATGGAGERVAFAVQDGNRNAGERGQGGLGITEGDGPMFTLHTGPMHGVDDAVHVVSFAENQRGEVLLSDEDTSLSSTGGGKPGQGYPAVLAFDWQNSPSQGMAVRSACFDALRASAVPAVLAVDTFNQDTSQHVFHTLRTGGHGDSVPAVFGFHMKGDGADASAERRATLRAGTDSFGGTPPAVCVTGTVMHSLMHEGADASEDGTGRGTPIVAFNETGHERWKREAVAGTLAAHEAKEAHTLVVTYSLGSHAGCAEGDQTNRSHAAGGAVGFGIIEEGSPALRAGRVQSIVHAVPRRLTPLECERLMSWDDGWTDVPDAKGTPASDAVRYKAAGNGVVSNVAEWIARRLATAEQEAA